MSLPPGPRGALWQTIRYVRDPLAFYLGCVKRYGDLFTVPSVVGPIVVVSRPEHVRALFSLPPSAFSRFHTEAVSPLLGASSVLLTTGERHLQQRRMMAPSLHRERIEAFTLRIAHLARAHAAAWPVGEEFALQDRLVPLCIDVVLSVGLGIEAPDRLVTLRAAMMQTLAAMGPTLMLTRAVHERLAEWAGYGRFHDARKALDGLLYREIDAALAAPGEGDHLLRTLIEARDTQGNGFGRDELRDQLVTVAFAGHETMAIALTWCVYWLQKHPAALARLLGEIDAISQPSPAALAALPYLDAVCRETLRLYPTVPEVIRKLRQPLQLGAVSLPAGTAVAACIVATHAREELYPEPGVFKPERFLDRRHDPDEYLPFGGGVHRCAGEAFAWMEMKVILCALLAAHRFTLTRAAAVTPRLRSLTMGPRGGVRVMMASRTA